MVVLILLAIPVVHLIFSTWLAANETPEEREQAKVMAIAQARRDLGNPSKEDIRAYLADEGLDD